MTPSTSPTERPPLIDLPAVAARLASTTATSAGSSPSGASRS
jgi:hypothetical protein